MNYWIRSRHLNATSSIAVYHGESYVTGFSPTGSPGVFHSPVSFRNVVTDCQNAVIQRSPATGLVKDSIPIKLPGRSINSERNRLLSLCKDNLFLS